MNELIGDIVYEPSESESDKDDEMTIEKDERCKNTDIK